MCITSVFCQNIGYDSVSFTLEKRRMAGMLLFRVSLVTPIIQQFATGLQGKQPQEFAFAENRFFSTKKDGTKPSFLVTIFSWKIKAICTNFVRYCLCTVLPQKAYWFSAGASAAGAVFSSRSRCRSRCGYRAVREDTFQTGSQTSQPLNLAGDNDLGLPCRLLPFRMLPAISASEQLRWDLLRSA